MSEKINKKYGNSLTDDQKSILQEYVFSISEENQSRIVSKLLETRKALMKDLSTFEEVTENKVLIEKISDVREKIISESAEEINDESISRFLVLVKLREEIKEAISE